MRLGQPKALDVRSIIECANAARETPEGNEVFLGFLEQTFGYEDWHHDKGTVWHASQISSCARALMYGRQGYAEEEPSAETTLGWDIGKQVHAQLQFGIAIHPDYELIGHEIGGHLERLNLKGKLDILYRFEDRIVMVDVKTEKSRSFTMRRKDYDPPVRPDHALQLSALDMIVWNLHKIEVDEHWVCYVNRDTGEIDNQPANVGHDNVVIRLEQLEIYAKELPEIMPPRLPDKHWNCMQRSTNDPRGAYCAYRSICRGGNT